MAKSFKTVKSDDALTVIVNGDKRKPEPTHLIVKLPFGYVEVARCSDDTYWVHVIVPNDELTGESISGNVLASRVGYDFETYKKSIEAGREPIPEIAMQEHISQLSVQLGGKRIKRTDES